MNAALFIPELGQLAMILALFCSRPGRGAVARCLAR